MTKTISLLAFFAVWATAAFPQSVELSEESRIDRLALGSCARQTLEHVVKGGAGDIERIFIAKGREAFIAGTVRIVLEKQRPARSAPK